MGKVVGFAAAAIAAFGFGSNFIPVKQYDMGDGMFFQLIMAIGIWLFGLGFEVVSESKTSYFHPIALLGGFIWCTGNVLTVPIIKMIGMALGLAIWSGVSLSVGWMTGKFGLLGTPKDDSIKSQWMNYLGLVLALGSLVIFFNVKPMEEQPDNNNGKNKSRQLSSSLSESTAEVLNNEQNGGHNHEDSRDQSIDRNSSNVLNVKILNGDNNNQSSAMEKSNDKSAFEYKNMQNNSVNQRVGHSQKNKNKNKDSTAKSSEIIKTQTYFFNRNLAHLDSESPAVFAKRARLIAQQSNLVLRHDMELETRKVESWVDKLKPRQKQILGVLLCVISGTCYGLCFTPIQYLITSHNDSDEPVFSQSLEDYAFTHYCGILLCANLYFVAYVFYTKNKPQVNNIAILPGMLSGILWAVAQTGFFVATDKSNLGTDTAFPLVSGSPQIVASLWGVLLFKEVQGFRDLGILSCGICVGVSGIAMIALSKF